MSMEWIRNHYGVPAKRGARVIFRGSETGTITSSRDGYIKIRMDGEKRIDYYHPTWEMEYLSPNKENDDD